MKKRLWTIVYALALTAFSAYVVLDTFVLRSKVQTNATEQNTAMFDALSASAEDAATTPETKESASEQQEQQKSQSSGEGGKRKHKGPGKGMGHGSRSGASGGQGTASGSDEESGNSAASAPEGTQEVLGTYEGEGKTITLTKYREKDTWVYVADVVLSSAQSLQTAFAEDTFGRNVTQTTSSIASDHNAVLAINGDYYGAQERGYVIRNGVVYRSTAAGKDLLCIYADGTMKVLEDNSATAQELVEEGVWQAFSFGPGIVEQGSVSVSEGEEVGKAMASNPRTAIGMIAPNHYVFVVSDGRTTESEGLSLYELAQFMDKLGVETAYNLDGGGSSTMYFQGQVVNNPTTNGSIRERGVSDIVYIGK